MAGRVFGVSLCQVMPGWERSFAAGSAVGISVPVGTHPRIGLVVGHALGLRSSAAHPECVILLLALSQKLLWGHRGLCPSWLWPVSDELLPTGNSRTHSAGLMVLELPLLLFPELWASDGDGGGCCFCSAPALGALVFAGLYLHLCGPDGEKQKSVPHFYTTACHRIMAWCGFTGTLKFTLCHSLPRPGAPFRSQGCSKPHPTLP